MTPALLALPPELFEAVLDNLQPRHLKHFRLVFSACAAAVNPRLFKEVCFDLEIGGCDNLAQICLRVELRRHVRSIHLKRRGGLKGFASFEDWQDSNIYEYIPAAYTSEEEGKSIASDPISKDDWKALDDGTRKDLYGEYEAEKIALRRYISRLVSAAFPDLHGQGAVTNHNSTFGRDDQQTLRYFRSSIAGLSNVNTFLHAATYEDEERWGKSWRGLSFHPEALVTHGLFGDDPNIDSIQLFIALQSAMLANNCLVSAQIYTRGRGFWGTSHLCQLLDWSMVDGSHASIPHEASSE